MLAKIEYYYKKGYYQKRHMLVFLQKGVITGRQYQDIVGEVPNA